MELGFGKLAKSCIFANLIKYLLKYNNFFIYANVVSPLPTAIFLFLQSGNWTNQCTSLIRAALVLSYTLGFFCNYLPVN